MTIREERDQAIRTGLTLIAERDTALEYAAELWAKLCETEGRGRPSKAESIPAVRAEILRRLGGDQ